MVLFHVMNVADQFPGVPVRRVRFAETSLAEQTEEGCGSENRETLVGKRA